MLCVEFHLTFMQLSAFCLNLRFVEFPYNMATCFYAQFADFNAPNISHHKKYTVDKPG